jgi:hypothetical protein
MYDDGSESGSPRASWKLAAMIAGAATLAIVIVVGAVWFARSRQEARIGAEILSRVESRLDKAIAECADEANPDACREREVSLAATSAGSVALCDKLDGEARDGCIWDAAGQAKDPTMCSRISDQTRASVCSDALYAKLAMESKDARLCQKISSQDLAKGCEGVVDGPVTAETCAARGEDVTVCDKLRAYEAAVASEDPAQCNSLAEDNGRNLCLEAVGSGDRDHDGLSAVEEQVYGTSDTNSDTDGDGFTDSAEVQNGYNPNGPGRL